MTNDLSPVPLVLRVRAGEIATPGWVYAWVSVPAGDVVYVGATRLPPQVRTWLHLHDVDPAVARVASRYPSAAQEELDVLAFPVPDHLDRAAVKQAVVTELHDRGLLGERYVGDAPIAHRADEDVMTSAVHVVEAVAQHRRPPVS